jgi:hypothetical protein
MRIMSFFGLGKPDIDKMIANGDSKGLLKVLLDKNHPENTKKVAEAFGPKRIFSIASSGIINPPFSTKNDPPSIDIETRGRAFIALAFLNYSGCDQAIYNRIVKGFSMEEQHLFGSSSTTLALKHSKKAAVSALIDYLDSSNFHSLDFSKAYKGSGVLIFILYLLSTLHPISEPIDPEQIKRLESIASKIPLIPAERTAIGEIIKGISTNASEKGKNSTQ